MSLSEPSQSATRTQSVSNSAALYG